LDIQLDGTKPSFNERRHIQVPHVQQQKAGTISAKIAANLIASPPPEQPAPEQPAATVVDKGKKITRTKPKKRQIRLGHIEEPKPIPSAAIQEEDQKHVHRLAELEEAVQQEAVKSRKAGSVRSRKSKVEEIQRPTSPASDKFRKKIEAMRKEAGTEWLRVLQEMDVVKKEKE
jgi:hypothetical protein